MGNTPSTFGSGSPFWSGRVEAIVGASHKLVERGRSWDRVPTTLLQP